MADDSAGASENVTSQGDPPQARRRAGLVAFLFGVCRAERLPGVGLVALLGDLGLSTSAARAQLARMRRDGNLTAGRRGREVDYALGGAYAAQFRRLRDGHRPPVWDGHFHALLYQVPLAERGYRDRLRRAAQVGGYGLVQPGVLIAVDDRSAELAAVLADAPAGARIRHATLGMPVSEAADVAAQAWDLDALASTLRGHVATLGSALAHDGDPPATAATLRRFAELRNAPLVDLLLDPGLPADLLPADWPGAELAELQRRVLERYLPPANRYARTVTGLDPGPRRPGTRSAPG